MPPNKSAAGPPADAKQPLNLLPANSDRAAAMRWHLNDEQRAQRTAKLDAAASKSDADLRARYGHLASNHESPFILIVVAPPPQHAQQEVERTYPGEFDRILDPRIKAKADAEAQRERAIQDLRRSEREFWNAHAGPMPADVRERLDQDRQISDFLMRMTPLIGSTISAIEQFEKGNVVGGVLFVGLGAVEFIPIVKGATAAASAARGVARFAPNTGRIGGTALWEDLRLPNYNPANRPVMTVPQAREFLEASGIRGLDNYRIQWLRDSEFERLFGAEALGHYGPPGVREGVTHFPWTEYTTVSGQVRIDLRVSLLSDPEALLAAVRHETREIAHVRRLWRSPITGQFQPGRLVSGAAIEEAVHAGHLLANEAARRRVLVVFGRLAE